jgi:hypothetical protein
MLLPATPTAMSSSKAVSSDFKASLICVCCSCQTMRRHAQTTVVTLLFCTPLHCFFPSVVGSGPQIPFCGQFSYPSSPSFPCSTEVASSRRTVTACLPFQFPPSCTIPSTMHSPCRHSHKATFLQQRRNIGRHSLRGPRRIKGK